MFTFLFQYAKTFFNLMSHIAKDQTLQYILTMLDDSLQVRELRHQSKIIVFNFYAPIYCTFSIDQ